MAATYTHVDGRTILEAWGTFEALAYDSIEVGDLCYHDASNGMVRATQTTTSSALTKAASCVALEKVASGTRAKFALAVVIKAPDTLATGGIATAGSLAAAGDEGEPLYLSSTAGAATGTLPTPSATVILQVVGYVLATDKVMFCPRSILVPTCS